jgi:hypothetical protein
MLSEPIEVTLRFTDTLETLAVRYLVGGSLASSLHGIPRATQDVDLVAELAHGHVAKLVELLERDFYIDADMIHDAIDRESSFNVIEQKTVMKIDVFVMRRDELSVLEMDRREAYEVSTTPSRSLYLCTAEDVILQKLDWYENGNRISDRQWRDVLGVMKVRNKDLDIGYIKKWAAKLGLEELIDRAFSEATRP